MTSNYVIKGDRESPEWSTKSQSLELTTEVVVSTNLTKFHWLTKLNLKPHWCQPEVYITSHYVGMTLVSRSQTLYLTAMMRKDLVALVHSTSWKEVVLHRCSAVKPLYKRRNTAHEKLQCLTKCLYKISLVLWEKVWYKVCITALWHLLVAIRYNILAYSPSLQQWYYYCHKIAAFCCCQYQRAKLSIFFH